MSNSARNSVTTCVGASPPRSSRRGPPVGAFPSSGASAMSGMISCRRKPSIPFARFRISAASSCSAINFRRRAGLAGLLLDRTIVETTSHTFHYSGADCRQRVFGTPDRGDGSRHFTRLCAAQVRSARLLRCPLHFRSGVISRHGGAPAECPLSGNRPRCWGRIATSCCKRTGRPFAAGFQWTNLTPHVVPCRHTTWQRVVVLKPSDDRSKSEEKM